MSPRVGLALLLLAAAPQVYAQETAPVDSLALARLYTHWLYVGEVDSLVAHSGEQARAGFATIDGFRQHSDGVATMGGEEVGVIQETWKLRNGVCQYWRVAAFSDSEDLVLLRWIIDPDGMIAGLGLSSNERAPPVDSETCEPPG